VSFTVTDAVAVRDRSETTISILELLDLWSSIVLWEISGRKVNMVSIRPSVPQSIECIHQFQGLLHSDFICRQALIAHT